MGQFRYIMLLVQYSLNLAGTLNYIFVNFSKGFRYCLISSVALFYDHSHFVSLSFLRNLNCFLTIVEHAIVDTICSFLQCIHCTKKYEVFDEGFLQ